MICEDSPVPSVLQYYYRTSIATWKSSWWQLLCMVTSTNVSVCPVATCTK